MKRLFCIALIILPFLSQSQDLSRHYKIYNVRQQQIIDIDAIVADMAQAQVLFFGEEHNDSIGHYLEAALLQKLALAYGNKVALTLEMFHTDVQPVLDEYLAGIITEKNFLKEARAWNNYKDYRPMVEFAKAKALLSLEEMPLPGIAIR